MTAVVISVLDRNRQAHTPVETQTNWIGIQAALASSIEINQLLSGLNETDPVLAGALVVGLGQAATGQGITTFAAAWQGLKSLGKVSTEVATELGQIFADNGAPEYIVQLIQGVNQ